MVDYSIEQQAAWLKSLDARVSSAAVIIEDKQGRALIVKANYKSHWTFPGGIIDPGETPAIAAARDVLEEVGLLLAPETLTFAWVASRTSMVAQTYQFIFEAPLPEGGEQRIMLQAAEIDDYVWVSKADVLAGERHYGKVIENWANGVRGYVEQTYGVV